MYIMKDAITTLLNKRFTVNPWGYPTHLGEPLSEPEGFSLWDGVSVEFEAEFYYQKPGLRHVARRLKHAIKVKEIYA